MKDNEKQIEEMKNNARIYIGGVVEKLRMDGCELYEIDRIVENILNYITVPGDSVVLTKSELEQVKEQAVKEFAEKLREKFKKEIDFQLKKDCNFQLEPLWFGLERGTNWCMEQLHETLKEVIGEKE